MNLISLIAYFGFLLSFALASLAIPQAPTDDDFYVAPANLSLYNEGDIVKWRASPQKIRSMLYSINIDNAWQFMVRSTDNSGNPMAIVGTIIKPYDADPKKVLAYNYAEDSSSKNCAPSYSILFGADVDTVALQAESIFMNVGLAKGWYVLATDHEGPNAAFTAGRLAGMAVLNSIRATLKSGKDTGVSPDAKVAIWGYSGGTVPSGWAAALQPSRAPELSNNLIGVAVGGWVNNITQVVQQIDGGIFAGFVGAGIVGLATEYPVFQNELYSLIEPDSRDRVKSLEEQCEVSSLPSFALAEFFIGELPIFTDGTDVLYRPEIQAVLNDNILSFDRNGPVPEVPVFVYHGKPDEVIPFSGSKRVYDNWCAQGIASMEFAASTSTGHALEFGEGAGAALAWLTNRFNGEAPVDGCLYTERDTNLDYPGADASFFEEISTTIEAFLQFQLGPALLMGSSPDLIQALMYNGLVNLITLLGPIPLRR